MKACKDLKKLTACLGEMGVELPDELLDAASGGDNKTAHTAAYIDTTTTATTECKNCHRIFETSIGGQAVCTTARGITRFSVRVATPTLCTIADGKQKGEKNIEEKKNVNQPPEIGEEELDQVAGGYPNRGRSQVTEDYSYSGPLLTCSVCGKPFTPENVTQETNKFCPTCAKLYRL